MDKEFAQSNEAGRLTGTVPAQKEKHVILSEAVVDMRLVKGRLKELLSKISRAPFEPEDEKHLAVEASLLDVLQGSADDLDEIRTASLELIDQIDAMLFNG